MGRGCRLTVGTSVDCLFEDDYFRGAVDEANGGERQMLFRVVFDDGDVREDVPPEDMTLPLEPGCLVECLYEGEDAYFNGTIAKDNGDATYEVDFDDGDVLSAAPRRDIRPILMTDVDRDESQENEVSKGAAADTAGGLEEQRRSLNDATHISDVGVGENNDGAQRERSSGDAGITSTELDVGDSSQGRQEGKSSSSGESQPVRNGEDGSDGDDGDDRRHECVQRRPADSASSSGGGKRRQQNARGSTSSAPGDSDESSIVRHRGKEVAETPSSVRRKDQGSAAGESDSKRNRDAESGRARSRSSTERSRVQHPASGSMSASVFTPMVANPLHAHLDALAVAAPRLLVDAPPDFRLWAVCHRIAALEEQLRQQEARGEAWNLPVFSETSARHAGYSYQTGKADQPRSPDHERGFAEENGEERTSHGATTLNARAAEPSFPAHAELRKVVEDLSALRMRQVSLVRLCYGDASLEMVQAITALAGGYAKEGLWPQVSNHMARAANILASDQDERFRKNHAFAGEGGHAWHSVQTTSPGYISRFVGHTGASGNGRGGAAGGEGIARGLTFPTEDRYSDPALWGSLSPARCAFLLLELFKGLRSVAENDCNNTGQVAREDLEALFCTHQHKTVRSAAPGLVKGAQMPSSCGWGVAVDCLRQKSCSFADLNLKVMEGVQPKNAAKIQLAFRAAESESTGCANAQLLLSELHATFSRNDGGCLEALYPHLLSAVADIAHVNRRNDSAEEFARRTREEEAQVVGPPITWEEVLALTVAVNEGEQAVQGVAQPTEQERWRWRSLLSARVKLLTGRYQTHTNSLPAACRNLSEALAELERLGLGEASGCVPVLNALTDALALTHRRHAEKSATKAKKLAQTWIQGKEGQELWKQECKRLLLECRRRLEVVPRAEIETRTWQALKAYRSKILARELVGHGKELDTAEDYLVRAWETLESRHGRMNPDVGAACISLGNLAVIRKKQDEAIDWFRRALGTFEECFPDGYTPVTASTAVTLGNLLMKRGPGTDDTSVPCATKVLHEATGLMERAAKFYSGRVEKALARHDRTIHLNPPSPSAIEDAFAWSDPSLPGSRLDPQTTDFARRAAELWTQAAGLREFAADNDATSGNGPAEGGGTEFLAGALEQAVRATAISRGPCSVALGRLCRKLGEVRQREGDYPAARDAFSQARAIFVDRFGRNDGRARGAAAAAVAAHRKTPAPSPATGRAFNGRSEGPR